MGASLVVPINLQALCVGSEDVHGSPKNPYGTADFAQIAANFANLPYMVSQDGSPVNVNYGPNVSEAVTPPLFETVSPPLQPGIHLHWTLPDAIARALSSPEGVTIRSAPNRWFIARIAANNANPGAPVTSINAWVVESDTLWDPVTANDPLPTNLLSIARLRNPIPDPSKIPNQSFQTVGRTFPYATWKEPGTAGANPHTAFGYGDISYASAYAMSPNVFGMYDTLADLDPGAYPPATTNISYVVAGWYADLKDDPLAQLLYPLDPTSDQIVKVIEEQFGWTFAADSAKSLPAQVLCNGILTGISWDPNRQYLKSPDTSSISVAVGNTTAEALSALLAAQPGLSGLKNVEKVLNALQLSLLSRLTQPDGLMQIEETQHQAQFGSSTAGTLWVINPATPTDSDGNVVVTGLDLLKATQQQLLPQGIGDDLNQLNFLQQKADALQFEIDSYRRQIFADWFKYMILEYTADPPAKADIVTYLSGTILPALNHLLTVTQPAVRAQVIAHSAKVAVQLGKTWKLESTRTPRYWSPNDPVVLLSGDSLGPFYRSTNPLSYDANGNLICRLATRLVDGMQIASPAGGVKNAQLPQLPASTNSTHAAEIAALLSEAFYVDPNQAPLLASIALGPQAGDLWRQIQAAQDNLWSQKAATNVSFGGVWPAPMGFEKWSSPWVPLLMEWEVNYYPWAPIDDEGPPTAYTPSFVTGNFKLDEDSIDLVNLNSQPSPLPPLEVYRGFALLTHNAEINIVNQIKTYLKNYPNDPYAAELQQILESGTLPMMAQALGGFTQGLQMRKQTLQLPIFDPLAATQGLFTFSNQTVPGAVLSSNTSAPMPLNLYNPIRAGFMQVSQLWLVDIFGQKIALTPPSPQVIRASSLIPSGDDPGNPMIGLPPRVAQPARLLFRWLSADNDAVEMNSAPATTPIFGWVLFNHLDECLMIYDAGGTLLGSLNVRGPLWTGAPGNNGTLNQPIGVAFVGANPHLRDFAFGIHDNPDAVNFLKDLLAAIDSTITLTNPESSDQTQALSVLIGRPIALVRASLSFDLQGLPAINQSWTEITQAANKSLPMEQRDNAQFPAVQFPVRLGDLANLNDGLIGYFMDTDAPDAYRTFYAHGSTHTSHGVVPPGPDQLKVSASSAPVVISMMMDPRAGVHATSGIVPVKAIQIPPFMYADALAQMAVTFLTTPVLSAAANFSLPVPKEDGFAWSWISVDPATKRWVASPINPAAAQSSGLAVQQCIEGWLRLSELPT
jgi:hypothetical protein